MAATALTVESSTITGTTLTQNAVNTGDGVSFENNGTQKIVVINNSGGDLTFTAVTTYTAETTLNLDDRNYTLANGSMTYVGTYAKGIYGTTVTLNNFNTATSVTVLILG